MRWRLKIHIVLYGLLLMAWTVLCSDAAIALLRSHSEFEGCLICLGELSVDFYCLYVVFKAPHKNQSGDSGERDVLNRVNSDDSEVNHCGGLEKGTACLDAGQFIQRREKLIVQFIIPCFEFELYHDVPSASSQAL
jgi:hypothetical protein